MSKITDEQLRELLVEATEEVPLPWKAVHDKVVCASLGAFIDVGHFPWGGITRLVALAPELAAEVLEARRKLRDLTETAAEMDAEQEADFRHSRGI